MPLTRQYLRYAQAEVFGVIASNKSNVLFLDVRGTRGKYCAVGACEDVIVWDIRTGEKVFESLLEKTNNLHMQKQRGRSAVQLLFSLHI